MIYGDDNIHTAMEKIAGLPGHIKKKFSKEGLKLMRRGKNPFTNSSDQKVMRELGEAGDQRVSAYLRGREGAVHTAKARGTGGQERAISRGDAAHEISMGGHHKKKFRKLVPKPQIRTVRKVTTKDVPSWA